jgi:hypothetical protein
MASDGWALGGGFAVRPRAQTTLDFAIGISVFLLIVLFVFIFIPGTLDPFTVGAQEQTVTSDRVADSLSEGLLGDPAEPYVLDRFCTVEFFAEAPDGNPPVACRYDGADLQEWVGVKSRQSLNITVSGNTTAGVSGSNVLCWDDGGASLAEPGAAGTPCDDGADVRLTAGDAPPTDNAATVRARRVVSLAAEDVTIRVVMW